MFRKILKFSLILILIAGVVAGGFYAWDFFTEQQSANEKEDLNNAKNDNLDRTFITKRDNLIIGLLLSGNVTANKKHKLSLQVPYRTQLLSVVDENSAVKKDQIIAVFETDELKEKIDELTINISNQDKELAIAIENAKIQESNNEMDEKVAIDRLNQAEAALRKYLRLERNSLRNDLRLAISAAETSLETAQQDYDDKEREIDNSSETDEDKVAENEDQLNTLANNIDSKDNALTSARNKLKAFQRYDNPIKLLTLYNNLDQAKLNCEKVKISTASSLVQRNKQVDNLRNYIRRLNNQLRKYESYLPKMKLVAPSDGIVIYADPDRRWGNPDVKAGMDVYKGLVLLTIPEMSNLMIDFDLPEQYRSKVALANKVIITPDSIPTLRISGKISKIATLPINQISWDSASPKVYRSRVALNNQHKQLVNGMSVSIEIISKIIPNTIFIPVEAVFEKESKYFVYMKSGLSIKEVFVEIGESNDRYVQIVKGINEGDEVYLYRPYEKNKTE